jgi:hypothetical protein
MPELLLIEDLLPLSDKRGGAVLGFYIQSDLNPFSLKPKA